MYVFGRTKTIKFLFESQVHQRLLETYKNFELFVEVDHIFLPREFAVTKC